MNVKELFDLTGKTSIVTGGGRGLGLIFAKALAEAGSTVVLCSRKRDTCQEAAKQLEKSGFRAVGLECDITNEQSISTMKDTVLSEFGSIDILVNNSGATWGAKTEDYPLKGWNKVINVNVTGTFLCSTLCGKAMIEQGGGKIINIGSVASVVGSPSNIMDAIAYNTSKGAILTFTKDLAVKWAKYNVCVNAIGPAYFPTDMTSGTLSEKNDAILARVPMKRLGKPEELKGAVVYLASKASDYVTGTILFVDGGYRAM